MADASASEKTEPPTAERLRKARRDGQVPQSQELPSVLMLVALLLAIAVTAGDFWQWLTTVVEQGLSFRHYGTLDIDAVMHLLKSRGTDAMMAMAPFFLATSAASVLGSVAVSGLVFSPKAVRWDLSRLKPSTGLQQVFSPRSAMSLGMTLAKLAILGTIAWAYLRDKEGLCLAMASAMPLGALKMMAQLVFGLVARITIALVVLAVADVIFQKWQYKRQLRMTKQEVKEERKSFEGSTMVKHRMQLVHFAMLRKRMLRQVPLADVVVVNPTHVAVALKYDAGTMQAPVAVAKGADLLCEKIKEIARKHRVPVVEKPDLARALYAGVEVGQPVPEALYVAVAEVLAMIFRMRKQA
ncbi:MAG: EscU/YscU/HrcU family type III secretion system export apparatus switch protein [Planctomycetota bacterium]|nr:EscU/YscU/HrcU family type III secretion system export apparatus switch protein [Planctomycetota bacterium]